ncbi:succinate dehydrogenase cytochrome b subunit [Aureispira sp. CCB-E]|uniref:succinate dehydrogenase cytochrome b subunit n=1 Tax=Aureispira sp. CCB-E TaxID=3051121 RepID=UPI0028684A21|nr:succinate dehydrogenase cytochrome b subunit [Aureispira sp. CCB-E]WMX14571.1 succinate dehydrogenase cytochrome b subunit [Aureispira sp. CCB-E]
MKWIIDFLLSSLGKKLIMSLTGLFLCLFLVVHMLGNLQLFFDNTGETFNLYAYHMTHNPLIKVISYGNYFFILLHAVQGILITAYNRKAKGGSYQGKEIADTEAKLASRNMRNLGLLIFVFIGLHMWQFWAQMHFFEMGKQTYDGLEVKDLYSLVKEAFSQAWVVIFYLISLVALALHLMHGFWSAFQTMGLNNKKYAPIIRAVAMGYSILIPLGFASMPIVFFVLK